MFRPAISLIALAAAMPAFAQEAPGEAPEEAPVREVVLFEAGLAELTRETGAARSVTLSVPLRDVNDVLKSLLVRGVGITGASMALDGQTPVEDALASLPFPPEAATDLVTLLRSVPGLRVRVADRGYPEGREGTVMGVFEDCTEERGCETVLTVLGDDGALRRHVFDADLEITILDPAITEALGRALTTLREAASGQVREIAVSIEGPEVEQGALSYVVAAPAWKTAYRALTGVEGEVDLQAWAVIENATGEDWVDVALTLSSGSPVTLAADLHGRDWRYRPFVEPDPGAPQPVVVVEPEAPRSMLAGALGLGAEDAVAAEAMPAPAAIEAGATGGEGVLDSRFDFAEPVDLAAGEMLSLPFLTDALEASHLSLWQGQLYTRTGNPEMVLEVTNDLGVRLPAGIMTVSDETGGYVGDADFPLVGPGETEAVPFGLDRKLRVEETVSETMRRISVRASEGVIRIGHEQLREVAYLVTSPSGEARELVIDHPLSSGWRTEAVRGPEGAAGEARQDDDGRRWLRFELPVGAEGAALVLRDIYPYEEVIQIGNLGVPDLLAWAGQVQDPEGRAYLEDAARLVRASSRAEEALMRAEEELGAVSQEQERVRRLLGSVTNPSEAYDRYLADLLELEDRIDAGTAQVARAREAARAAQDAVQAHLSGEE